MTGLGVKEVFAEANPTHTFIDRCGTKEFKRLKRELKGGGKIVRLHGPSKSGKTVMCRQALSELQPITIYGDDDLTKQNFWLKVSQEAGIEEGKVVEYLAGKRRPIIIDDFHWIAGNSQAAIIRSFKPFLDQNGMVVLISVPDVAEIFLDRARRTTKSDQILGDLVGKSVPVSPPIWSEGEIREIAETGFKKLNLVVSEGPLQALIRFSFRNPLLIQKHCAELCFALDIDERTQERTELSVSQSILEEVFDRIAEIDGQLFHSICTKGGRHPFDIGTGRRLSLRELVLRAIAQVNINQKVGLSKIGKNIKTFLVSGAAPDKNSIKKAFEDLIEEMNKVGQAGIVTDGNDYLYIAHPFFKSYLLWRFSGHCGVSKPDLDRYEDKELTE